MSKKPQKKEETTSEEPLAGAKVLMVSVDELTPSRHQHRQEIAGDASTMEDLEARYPALHELAKSILQHGVLQPITVRPGDETIDTLFEIVAGERRWRASRCAGLEEIPVIIRDFSDEEAAAVTLEENVERADLTPHEVARGVVTLLRLHGGDLAAVGRRLRKSEKWVARRAKIAELSKSWVDASSDPRSVVAGWGIGHLEVIAVLPVDQQEELWKEWRYSLPARPTVAELEERALASLSILSSAPWDLSDPDVSIECPACDGCPLRTSADPLLFPELQDPAGDRCTSSSCWRKKQQAHLMSALLELPEDGIPVMTGTYLEGEELPCGGAVSHLDVEPCAVDDDRAVRCVYVDGVNLGKSFWGRRRGAKQKESKKKSGPATMEERQERLERRRVRRLSEIACNLLCPVDPGTGDEWTEPEELDLERIPEWSVLASLVASVGSTLRLAEPGLDWHESAMSPADVRSSWTKSSCAPERHRGAEGAWNRMDVYKKNEDLLERDLWRQIAPILAHRCTYAPHRDVEDLKLEIRKSLELIGEIYDRRWAEVCRAIPEPAAWKNLASD